MALASAADLQARLSTQAYARLFAKNGGATADTAFRDMCLAEAQSEALTICAAAFPDGLEVSGGTVDIVIVGWVCDIACEKAAGRQPAATEMGGYFLAGQRARQGLRDMSKDRERRPVTAGTGPAVTTTMGGVVDGQDDGTWGAIASGNSWSGF